MDTMTSSYGADEGTTLADDRRGSDRKAYRVPAWVGGESSDRGAKGRNVLVNDLSIGGVGFHDPAAHYRVGATHWLIVNGGPMRLSTRMKIVNCRQNAEGGFDVGAAFF